ncbi:MAG: PAS domain-containing protein [Bacteroidota bacterium]|nr:PAS domain-containing protein [Bacteroidota bacterium]
MANEEAENVTGFTAEELIGTKWTDHVAPHSLEKMMHYHKVRRTNPEKVPSKYEVDLIHKSGEIRRSLLTIGMIPNSKLSIVTLIDVTKRFKAIEKLKESEEKFRSYIDFAPDGIFITDENGKYKEMNQAACDITGYSEQELLNMQISDLLQKSEIEKGVKHFQKVKEKGTARIEMGFVAKNGENRYWNIAAVKLSDNRFLGFVKDITDRKQAEEELHVKNCISNSFIHSKQEDFYKEVLDIFKKYFVSKYWVFWLHK